MTRVRRKRHSMLTALILESVTLLGIVAVARPTWVLRFWQSNTEIQSVMQSIGGQNTDQQWQPPEAKGARGVETRPLSPDSSRHGQPDAESHSAAVELGTALRANPGPASQAIFPHQSAWATPPNYSVHRVPLLPSYADRPVPPHSPVPHSGSGAVPQRRSSAHQIPPVTAWAPHVELYR